MPRSALTLAKQRLDRLTTQQERVAVERASALALVAELTAKRRVADAPAIPVAPAEPAARPRRFSRTALAAALERARPVQGRGA